MIQYWSLAISGKKRNLRPTCDFFVLPNICCPLSLGCHNVLGLGRTRFWDGQGLLWNLGFQQTKVFTCAWSSRLSWAHIGGSCQIPSPREVAGTAVEKSFQKTSSLSLIPPVSRSACWTDMEVSGRGRDERIPVLRTNPGLQGSSRTYRDCAIVELDLQWQTRCRAC